ncbi:MAG: hypothetical protein JO057_08795 [Chloroflexi bacterium]|nr:hypothetical protein [Chloroflexota bacterium]
MRNAEERAKAWLVHSWLTVAAILLLALAVAIRAAALPFQGWDYKDYFQHWFATLADSPGLTAFSQTTFSDYTPPYLYLLKLGGMLFPSQPLLVVKGISWIFEAALALGVYALVRRRHPTSSWAPLAAAALVVFGPTVLLDGSIWGQSEALYTSLLVFSLYWVMCDRNMLAFVCFAFAFAFKAQAVFFLPLLVVLYFRRRISVALFGLIPLVYILMVLPAVLNGMHVGTALGVYFNQASFYKKLAMNAPTIYAWIPDRYYDVFLWFGLAWAAAAGLALISACIVSRRRFHDLDWLRLALALVLVLPFFTPAMHDRYFYPADILSLVYAFYVPRRFYLPILVTGISVLSYLPFLFNTEVLPVKDLTLVMLLPVGIVVYDLYTALFSGPVDRSAYTPTRGWRRLQAPDLFLQSTPAAPGRPRPGSPGSPTEVPAPSQPQDWHVPAR